MAKSIKLVSKDVGVAYDGTTYCSAGLALHDGDTELNGCFLQPANLTAAVGGITEYGMLVFNSEDSDLSSAITVACVEAGNPVTVENTTSVSITLQDLMDTDPGDDLTESVGT